MPKNCNHLIFIRTIIFQKIKEHLINMHLFGPSKIVHYNFILFSQNWKTFFSFVKLIWSMSQRHRAPYNQMYRGRILIWICCENDLEIKFQDGRPTNSFLLFEVHQLISRKLPYIAAEEYQNIVSVKLFLFRLFSPGVKDDAK